MNPSEQDKFKRKLDLLLKNEEYNKGYKMTIDYFKQFEIKEVENRLKNFELLVNKDGNKRKKSKYVEPLIKYINNSYPELIEYTTVCRELNIAFLEISLKIDKLFNKLKKYYFPHVYIIVISKIEKELHKILNISNNYEETDVIKTLSIQTNILSYHQMTVESLGKLLKKMIEEQYDFNNKIKDVESRNDFISYMKRVNKKIESDSKLISLINEISYTYFLSNEIKESDLRVNRNSQEVVEFVYKSEKEYLRRQISENRMSNFDINEFSKFIDENEIKESDFENKELDSVVEINDKNFKLKLDFISDEFLSNIRTTGISFFHNTEQIIFNNFIDLKKLKSKVKKSNKYMSYTFQEAKMYYFGLLALASFYYDGVENYNKRVGNFPLITISVFDQIQLNKIISQIIEMVFKEKIDESKLLDLKELFTFGNDDIYDLYYKPLVCSGSHIIIIPSVLRKNNFSRTFIKHMDKIDPSFKEGNIYEEYILSVLKEHKFKVYDIKKPSLNFKLESGKQGDIDILALKDGFLFYGQAKNRPQPLDLKDYTNSKRNIKKAFNQLEHAEEYLRSNPKHILNHFKVKNLDKFKLVPFIITNSFYNSGDRQRGIPIIDTSSFNKVFNDGSINIHRGKEVIYEKVLRKSEYVTGEEFYNYIQKPYFLDPKIYPLIHYPSAHTVGRRLYIIGLET